MNKKGQALVEYILIIALISVIAIALVNYFGGYLKDVVTKSSCGAVGEYYVVCSLGGYEDYKKGMPTRGVEFRNVDVAFDDYIGDKVM